MIGSVARLSIHRKIGTETTNSTSSPITSGWVQGYPDEVARDVPIERVDTFLCKLPLAIWPRDDVIEGAHRRNESYRPRPIDPRQFLPSALITLRSRHLDIHNDQECRKCDRRDL